MKHKVLRDGEDMLRDKDLEDSFELVYAHAEEVDGLDDRLDDLGFEG